MTTIGRGSTARIAAACDDGMVGIYDSVTGVLRLSLSPPHPIQAMTGSPDGSILFCTHRETPSITLWDIQTGGLVHTFALTTEATDTAISLNGRYLACGLSDGTVNVWEVGNRTGGPAFWSDWPITCLCWVAPEEQLMVATRESVHIRDIATGSVLVHGFNMDSPVCGAVYSQKFNQLALVASSGANSFITIVDAQTGASSFPFELKQRLSCFAFSQTVRELVCGLETRELVLVGLLWWNRTSFDLPATIKSLSALSNGTMVANAVGIGIQLLSLDKGYVPSQQLIPPALSVFPLDKGRIIAIVPTNRDCVILLELAAMEPVFTISGWEGLLGPTDHTVVPCASLEKEIAVHCFVEGDRAYLQLWTFSSQNPRWTMAVKELPCAGDISPASARLVTFHCPRIQSYVHVRDMQYGILLARLDVGWSPRPLNITFDSEDIFHVYHDTYRTDYDITYSLGSKIPTHSITCFKKISSDGRASQRQYCVDDGHEWVVSGSQRICWIPPGYIGSDQASHHWVGSSLVMVGQDGTLRKLTFRESSL